MEEEKKDLVELTQEPLDVGAISASVTAPSTGATSLFVGTTRDNFDGKEVVRLEYEAYEAMARKQLLAVCRELRSKWADLHSIAIYHRLGLVEVKQASVVIAISSPHRKDAIQVNIMMSCNITLHTTQCMLIIRLLTQLEIIFLTGCGALH